ncbi:MAG: succinylglutamate desuccinylase/aspartoacylase family protein [Salibacteraceae bacterium]
MKILGREIKPGESVGLEMELAKLHTRNSLRIPVIIERAKKDGPVLLCMGGVHGDEMNGVAIVRDIIRKKYNKPKAGTIICIPVFNVFGYLNQQREFPDGRDLNRMFPGSASGSLAAQFAHAFTTEIATKVDYVLDFHTGGAERFNYPNARCDLKDAQLLELAKVFGAQFVVNSGYIPKSIREMFHKKGVPILLFEGGKSLELNDDVVEAGVQGAYNVMKHLGMHEGEPDNNSNPIIIKNSKWIRAQHSGIFETKAVNGTWVKKKDFIARISDPYGDFERRVLAPFDCYIFGLNTSSIVNKGDAIFHVSTELLE